MGVKQDLKKIAIYNRNAEFNTCASVKSEEDSRLVARKFVRIVQCPDQTDYNE